MSRREDAPRLAYLRPSRPHPEDRIRSLERRIAERQYRLATVAPLEGSRLLAEPSRP
jgi:hypothetical protein